MKKIIMSILAIVITIGIVSATAYAAFNDEAQILGTTITSGNADLKFEVDGMADQDNLDLSSFSTLIPKLYPGYHFEGQLWLKNHSTSLQALKVSGKITSAGGDWGALSDKLELAINSRTGYGTPGLSTGWHTFSEWNTIGYDLPTIVPYTDPIFHWGYDVYFRVKSDAGNEIAGKTLSNIVFTLTGTQVTP